ncbi:MAG: hypothetical protein HYZ75_09845 [Elusimicrobia bacterium]|nr:hypothetical protein [Elusimicrobiota bacterium]
MLPWVLALLLVPAARAVDIPEDWRCSKGEVGLHWKGMRQIPQTTGPNWGEPLNENAPTPYVWLAIYKERDRDIAERRAPIFQRWSEFTPAERCAYLKHFAKEAQARKREYDALTGWRADGGLGKKLAKPKGDEVIAVQDKEPLAGMRARFDAMRAWLSDNGMREDVPDSERAVGVLIKLGLLEVAALEFLIESGHFQAKVRIRFQAALKDKEALELEPELAKLLDDPAVQSRVIDDISLQLAKDWRNETILGGDFERRLREALEAARRQRVVEAASARAGQVQRSASERKALRKRTEAQVEKLEGELKDEKLLFPAAADPQLLVSLEEYRQGKRALYELIESKADISLEELRAAELKLLKEVCLTHYRSIRYKAEVIKTLCGE